LTKYLNGVTTPELWDAVRTEVDKRGEDGLFILTGSTSVDDSKIMHSGTGRIARIMMYSMSLFESKESNGTVSLLNRLFVIDEVPAWSPAIRSTSAIRASNKREFLDPSIAAAALKISPEILMQDLNTFGFLFETLCNRDLKAYSGAYGGEISYYRDRHGLEADCVLRLNDGKYALIEIKLGSRQIEEGAEHLLSLQKLIRKYNATESVKIKEPELLIVITGGEMAYSRNDGIYIIPVGCLME
jgi:predicted AAA+ superfamily ATPase